MDNPNTVRTKSYSFAIGIIHLSTKLKQRHHVEISSQLLRSGTSIGANIEEASASGSRKDFFHRMTIASQEARETHYWLRLLKDTEIVSANEISSLLNEAEELIKMLTSIVKTGKTQSTQNS